MTLIPKDLQYNESHEWVRNNDDGTFTVGITHHAQDLLGDVVFVELPEVDSELATDEECAVMESVKAASDIYSPMSGLVVEINQKLEDTPELINQSPYNDGWIFKLKSNSAQGLLSAQEYQKLLEKEAE